MFLIYIQIVNNKKNIKNAIAIINNINGSLINLLSYEPSHLLFSLSCNRGNNILYKVKLWCRIRYTLFGSDVRQTIEMIYTYREELYTVVVVVVVKECSMIVRAHTYTRYVAQR